MRDHASRLWLWAGLAILAAGCAARPAAPPSGGSPGPLPATATPAVITAEALRPAGATPNVEPPAPTATEPPAPTATEPPAPTATEPPAPTELPTPTPEAGGDDLTPEQQSLLASLPSQGAAPELENDIWLNSEPLRLANLRGKVVLLDMWTFG